MGPRSRARGRPSSPWWSPTAWARWAPRWCAPGEPAASPPRRFMPTARPAASRRPEAMARPLRAPPHTHKFGGAPLADAAGITHAANIALAHCPAPQVVVVSALGRVTDALPDRTPRAAPEGAAD